MKKVFEMRKVYLAIFVILFSAVSANAQRWKLKRFEAIWGIGASQVFGDIGGTADKNNLLGLKDIDVTELRPSVFAGARYKVAENQSVRANLIYGYTYGSDVNSKNDEYRDLEFTTHLVEFSFQYEYYFLKEDRRLKSSAIFNRRGMINNYARFAFYGFAGVGGTMFIPSVEGPERSLNHHHNEFQTEMGITACAPAGLGLKYTVDSRISLGFEIGGRYTPSDYLDGMTSVFSEAKDVYYFGLFSVVHKIRTDRRGRPIFLQRGPRRRF